MNFILDGFEIGFFFAECKYVSMRTESAQLIPYPNSSDAFILIFDPSAKHRNPE